MTFINYLNECFADKLNSANQNEIESPYLSIDLKCSYFDNTQLINKFKNCRKIKFLSWNLGSLPSKFDEFKEYINFLLQNNIYFDIICIQEIFSIIDQDLYKLENYNFVFSSRKKGKGGGVGIYIHKKHRFTVIDDLSYFEENLFESLTLKVITEQKKSNIISCVYRPNSPVQGMSSNDQMEYFIDKISNLQAAMSSYKGDSYIMSDLNLDLLKFESHLKTNDFIENTLSNGFLPLITKPTRVTHASCTLIDNILSNSCNNTLESGVILNSISDHFPIFHVSSQTQKTEKPKTFISRDITSEKIIQFNAMLNTNNWGNVLNELNPQISFENFHEVFDCAFNLHFPIKEVKFNKNIHKIEGFMTGGLMISRRKKLELGTIYSKNKTPENNIAYTTYRDIYNKAIKDAKKIFYREQLNQNKENLRKTWQTLRQVISKSNDKTSCIDEIIVNDTSYSNNHDISNKFNTYFTSIADEIASQINPSPLNPCDFIPDTDSVFKLREINIHVLFNLVKKMENKKSSDMFGLSNCLLKQIINSIAVPLVHIINQSIKTGQIPSQLKIAKVLPIFKYSNSSKMDKCNPGNYRPISLLPIFSKLLEKIVSEQLTRYLEFNQIIYEHQYGFQAKKSTLHPMIHLLNYLGQAKNENLITIGVFCDLAKCFDTISHTILLKKLKKIGIHGLELEWFKNYLSNRNQFVYTNGEKSDLLGISKGVPQGSILGPILFLVYINDIKNCTSLMTLLFADDSNFLISGKDLNEIIEILNIELKNICDWFRCNEMSLNPTKTKFMIFNKREDSITWDQIKIKLDFNNENENDTDKIRYLGYINQQSEIPAIKFLGVFIDSQLNFKYHIEYLRKKISRSLFLINRVKHILCEKSLVTLFHSFINSHLLYCLPAWSCGLESSIKPLVVLQKKAIRIIHKSAYNSHTPPLFRKINVLPIKELSIYTKLLFFYDFIRWRLPNSFDGVWIRNNLRNQRQLRNSSEFYIPIAKFKKIERFPLFSFQRLWNNFCHEKDLLNENIPKKTFALNLKDELFKSICNIEECNECT